MGAVVSICISSLSGVPLTTAVLVRDSPLPGYRRNEGDVGVNRDGVVADCVEGVSPNSAWLFCQADW